MATNWKKRIQRPIGVYVATVYVIFMLGIMRLIGTFAAIRALDGEVSLPFVVIEFALCLFTAASAVWAFTGANEGRISLLVMLPVNILWVGLWTLNAFTDGDAGNDNEAVRSLMRNIGATLTIVAIEGYFLSKGVVAYYKQHDGNTEV